MSSLAIAACAVTSAVAAVPFEGKVEMTIADNGRPPQPLVYQLRESQLRMDIAPGQPGTGTTLIMDFKKKQMMVVVEQEQMYMTRSIPTLLDVPDPQGGAGASAQVDKTFTATGKTTKLLGYDCKEYTTADSRGIVTHIWLTDQLGLFNGLGDGTLTGRSAGALETWEGALKGKDAFPLRVVGVDASGQEKYRLEVTSIVKQKEPDSAFLAPDGYKELNIGDMMGGPH